tara:strand:+ start:17 stop:280 length:264 start_codon:yes stop_codon:yes gene_type:complete
MERIFRKMSKYLQDPDYLFSILTILVKKNGGQIVLTEKEMKSVSTGDLIGMYFEPKTGNLILKEVNSEDMLRAQSLIGDKIDETYDN